MFFDADALTHVDFSDDLRVIVNADQFTEHGPEAFRLGSFAGRPLQFDPKAEKFVNDAEANRWLDRPKRAPWFV